MQPSPVMLCTAGAGAGQLRWPNTGCRQQATRAVAGGMEAVATGQFCSPSPCQCSSPFAGGEGWTLGGGGGTFLGGGGLGVTVAVAVTLVVVDCAAASPASARAHPTISRTALARAARAGCWRRFAMGSAGSKICLHAGRKRRGRHAEEPARMRLQFHFADAAVRARCDPRAAPRGQHVMHATPSQPGVGPRPSPLARPPRPIESVNIAFPSLTSLCGPRSMDSWQDQRLRTGRSGLRGRAGSAVDHGRQMG
jgi:hypothetical protein